MWIGKFLKSGSKVSVGVRCQQVSGKFQTLYEGLRGAIFDDRVGYVKQLLLIIDILNGVSKQISN